jgi:hypothetical protein
MSLFWLVLVVVGGILAATLLYGRSSYQHRAGDDRSTVFTPPLWMAILGVSAPAAVSIAVLIYLYLELSKGRAVQDMLPLAAASIIAGLLALAASIETKASYVEITDSKLRVKSMFRAREIDLNDVDAVLTYRGHIGVRTKDGKVVTISGYMGWSSHFRRQLLACITAHELRRRANGILDEIRRQETPVPMIDDDDRTVRPSVRKPR